MIFSSEDDKRLEISTRLKSLLQGYVFKASSPDLDSLLSSNPTIHGFSIVLLLLGSTQTIYGLHPLARE
jgi:hypothetical protein